MKLSIGRSITGGIRRVLNRNGAIFVIAYAVVGLVWQVTVNSLILSGMRERGAEVTDTMNMTTVDLPFSLLAAIGVVTFVLLGYLSVVAIRTFVGGHSDSIPSEYYTRNIGWVLVNTYVGGLVYGVVIFIGSVLLLVPGIIAYVAFVFMMPYIAVDDENFITALKQSWSLTRGHWLRLFVVLLILFGIGMVSGAVSSLMTLVTGSNILTTPLSMVTSVISLGIIAEAFSQLRSESTS